MLSRRDFAVALATIPAGMSIAGAAVEAADAPKAAAVVGGDGISRNAAAIHQEIAFKSSRKRVYAALTDAEQFEKVVRLSVAATSGMVKPGAPARISREPGGDFSLFAGYISGRQLEFVPEERLVQAWRTASWNPGLYSIVEFQFADQGSGTRLILDQRGFPEEEAEHLAQGWHMNYWAPLEKYLG